MNGAIQFDPLNPAHLGQALLATAQKVQAMVMHCRALDEAHAQPTDREMLIEVANSMALLMAAVGGMALRQAEAAARRVQPVPAAVARGMRG